MAGTKKKPLWGLVVSPDADVRCVTFSVAQATAEFRVFLTPDGDAAEMVSKAGATVYKDTLGKWKGGWWVHLHADGKVSFSEQPAKEAVYAAGDELELALEGRDVVARKNRQVLHRWAGSGTEKGLYAVVVLPKADCAITVQRAACGEVSAAHDAFGMPSLNTIRNSPFAKKVALDLYRLMDADGSGHVEQAEWDECQKILCSDTVGDAFHSSFADDFRGADRNCDGLVSSEEFLDHMDSLYQMLGPRDCCQAIVRQANMVKMRKVAEKKVEGWGLRAQRDESARVGSPL